MARKRNYSHGLSEREQAILSLTDAGVSKTVASRQLGLKVSYVEQVVRLYSMGNTEERRWRAAAARSNAAFLAALNGGRFDRPAGNIRSVQIVGPALDAMAAAIAMLPEAR